MEKRKTETWYEIRMELADESRLIARADESEEAGDIFNDLVTSLDDGIGTTHVVPPRVEIVRVSRVTREEVVRSWGGGVENEKVRPPYSMPGLRGVKTP